jgi:hypothetical protein
MTKTHFKKNLNKTHIPGSTIPNNVPIQNPSGLAAQISALKLDVESVKRTMKSESNS